jgi:hypothetical protein
MGTKRRTVDIDSDTAALLEARAASRKISVAELIADLANNETALPSELASLRARAEGPWSPEVLEEDARRLAEFEATRRGVPWTEVRTWLESWGTESELPPPISRPV